MFTYRQLLIVAAISSVGQLVFQLVFKSDLQIDYLAGMIVGFFTLIFNVWLLELFGFFKDETPGKEVKND